MADSWAAGLPMAAELMGKWTIYCLCIKVVKLKRFLYFLCLGPASLMYLLPAASKSDPAFEHFCGQGADNLIFGKPVVVFFRAEPEMCIPSSLTDLEPAVGDTQFSFFFTRLPSYRAVSPSPS